MGDCCRVSGIEPLSVVGVTAQSNSEYLLGMGIGDFTG